MTHEYKSRAVLVGHGYWGKNIARNLAALGGMYGVCDLDAQVHEQVAALYPTARRFFHLEEVLDDVDVDAVLLSSPAYVHASQAKQALRAGKDVFVEKPLALTYQDGVQVVELARSSEQILMVGHLLEYHPAVLQLEKIIREGELGELQYIYSNRLNLGKFRREENILWSFAPHDIAVILRLAGEEPIELGATGGAYLHEDVADTTVTNMLFASGLRAHVFVSWLHPYKEQKLVVVGSKMMAVFDDRAPDGEKLILHDKGADWDGSRHVPRRGEGVSVPLAADEPLRLEIKHFLDCVETRAQPRTDGPSALSVLQVLETAQHSLVAEGRRLPLHAEGRGSRT